MCITNVARKVRKVVDDTTGHTDRKEAASAARKRATETGIVGVRGDNGEISRRAKAKTRRSRGFRRNIFTSLLGDASFGKNIKSALKLGQTS